MSAKELSAAEAAREKGNAAFKAKEYVQALEAYAGALQLLDALSSDGELAERKQEATIKCRLNRAACLLKIQGFNAAASEAKSVIAAEPGNAKAHYRLGQVPSPVLPSIAPETRTRHRSAALLALFTRPARGQFA
jgi:hypothetical protein